MAWPGLACVGLGEIFRIGCWRFVGAMYLLAFFCVERVMGKVSHGIGTVHVVFGSPGGYC